MGAGGEGTVCPQQAILTEIRPHLWSQLLCFAPRRLGRRPPEGVFRIALILVCNSRRRNIEPPFGGSLAQRVGGKEAPWGAIREADVGE